MKLDILAFGAHPDDVELGCSGTIAKEISLGKKVGIIDLTRGELGTRGTVEIRNTEATKASEILGVSVRENLDMRDGFFVNDENHQLKVIKMIRKYQPEIVLCNAIQDRHIDHEKGSKLVSDACFLSGLIQIKTEINGEAQRPWRPKVVYHYIQWQTIEPDFVVDISDFMTQKMAERDPREEMLKAFRLFDDDETGKISFKNLKRVAKELGENMTDDEIQEMIDEADRDGDGEIGEEEFMRIMKKTNLVT